MAARRSGTLAVQTISLNDNDEAGLFVAFVGPSGVGKDSLLRGVAQRLSISHGAVLARRVITRPADPALEDHDTLDETGFQTARLRGEFCLSWNAHGLSYGIPKNLVGVVEAGALVLANLSRSALNEGRESFPHFLVLSITTDPNVRAERLVGRGRESEADIEARLARTMTEEPSGDDVITITNNGALEDAIATACQAIDGTLKSQKLARQKPGKKTGKKTGLPS